MEKVTILKLDCPDRVGLLSRITGFIAGLGGNLLEVHQFSDLLSNWFFARLEIDTASLPIGLPAVGLAEKFRPLADELKANWSVRNGAEPRRMVILVSKLDHCLIDLLWRWRAGEIAAELPAVISNHPDLRLMVQREDVAFFHVPFDRGKQEAFGRIRSILLDVGADVVVLARFMQILPPELCEEFEGRIINIHHSFLPAFIGANPYRRAYERGVKLIGATCHYATAELDDGPIIEQEVMRVEHYHAPSDLLRLGRDCERLALARGVRYHLADRVLLHGRRTIVFRD